MGTALNMVNVQSDQVQDSRLGAVWSGSMKFFFYLRPVFILFIFTRHLRSGKLYHLHRTPNVEVFPGISRLANARVTIQICVDVLCH